MTEKKIDENFTGVVKEYFDEEPTLVKKEVPYKNGEIHGMVREYVFDELAKSAGEEGITLIHETPYINGQKHGVEKEYDSNGDLMFETSYVEGKKCGIQKVHNYGGYDLIETSFRNDKENGLRTMVSDGVETVNFVNGEKQGLEIETIQDSLCRVTNYKDDKKQGFEVNCDWWTNSIESIKTFSEDKQDGKTYLFEEGEVVQVDEYSKGQLVSSKNDRLTLAKARIKEIPKIIELVCDGAANSKEKEKFRNQMQYRGYKLEPSGVVINDEAVKEGVSLQKPVKTEKLQQMITGKLFDDFLNS